MSKPTMRSFKRFATAATCCAVVSMFAGCATPARPEQMTISAAAVSRVNAPAALKGNIYVKQVTGGRETNPMWMSNVDSSSFEQALKQSLGAAGMLTTIPQTGAFELTTDLGKLDQPMLGFDMTVTSSVKYTLVDRVSRKEVFATTVSAPYTAKVSDAFVGTERLKLANEGSIRENIVRFLDQLVQKFSAASAP